jgi:hypothetical protein
MKMMNGKLFAVACSLVDAQKELIDLEMKFESLRSQIIIKRKLIDFLEKVYQTERSKEVVPS